MSTTMLGTSESTDPKPRRKTNETSKPDRDKTLKRWAVEDHQEAKRLNGVS